MIVLQNKFNMHVIYNSKFDIEKNEFVKKYTYYFKTQ